MSKFSRGDLVSVLVGEPWRTGRVSLTWSSKISPRTGMPLVEVILDRPTDSVVVDYFDEDELELSMNEYEFVAVSVDQEDFEQTHLGDWGTFEAAQDDALYNVAEQDDEEYKATHMIQINRRRKAGHVQGFKAYRW